MGKALDNLGDCCEGSKPKQKPLVWHKEQKIDNWRWMEKFWDDSQIMVEQINMCKYGSMIQK